MRTNARTLAQLIGLVLQRERVARGLSQRTLAERLGVTQSWLARVELGQARTSIDRIGAVFAGLELQLRVEVEPLGTDLDDDIAKYRDMTGEERAEQIELYGWYLGKFDGLPYVLTGRLAAFAQGAPLGATILDLAVAEADLGGYAETFERHVCRRWSEAWLDWGWGPMDPRTPGPMRWLVGGLIEVRLHVADAMPRSVVVNTGRRELRVVPLADLEVAFADIRRVLDRWRSINP
jgi:transcriptional regulator with XRE-family HTH domain